MTRFASTGLLLLVLVCLLIDCGKCEHKEIADRHDPCKINPCHHNGICVQTNVSPGFKCICYGTGYFGSRCKLGCPGTDSKSMPTACIVI